jgi:hypothetical protein
MAGTSEPTRSTYEVSPPMNSLKTSDAPCRAGESCLKGIEPLFAVKRPLAHSLPGFWREQGGRRVIRAGRALIRQGPGGG